ncbi:hypothetical protein ACFRCG_29090 [Embleya sp. NPDC056575]|uniref:hypothetical protein n=1 Tax=unclassified Embleya TaxID=2699296 RepID=UPI0036A9FEF1
MTFASDPQSPPPTPGRHEPAAPAAHFETWAPPPAPPVLPPRNTSRANRSRRDPTPRQPTPMPGHPMQDARGPAVGAPAAAVEDAFHEPVQGPPADAAERLLRLVATHRTVPDVARMVAILRDYSEAAADDALREAAMTRPVSDLVLLADLLRDPDRTVQTQRPGTDPERR